MTPITTFTVVVAITLNQARVIQHRLFTVSHRVTNWKGTGASPIDVLAALRFCWGFSQRRSSSQVGADPADGRGL